MIEVTSPSLPKRAIERFGGQVVAQQGAIALGSQAAVDDPLFGADCDAEADGHLRRHRREPLGHRELPPRHAAAEAAAVQIDEQRRVQTAAPPRLWRNSNARGTPANSPPLCCARHSGIAKGSTWTKGRAEADDFPPAGWPRVCTRTLRGSPPAPRNSTWGAKGKTLRYSRLPHCGLITASASKRKRSSRASTICRCSLTPPVSSIPNSR